MPKDDPYQDAFKAAAEATRARIRRDRARAPKALKKVLTVVASRLFDPLLNATERPVQALKTVPSARSLTPGHLQVGSYLRPQSVTLARFFLNDASS